MATITAPAAAGTRGAVAQTSRIALRGVSWATFLRLVEEVGDTRVRKAYNDGVLELMSPGIHHESRKKSVASLIEILIMELDLPAACLGSTLFRDELARRGLEPDECYLFLPAAIEAAMAQPVATRQVPRPDLAIEIDYRRGAVDRPAIYAGLGVAEVWRVGNDSLEIDRLRGDGTYELADASGFLPISRDEIARWAFDPEAGRLAPWSRRLRAWIAAEVRRRRAGGG